MRDISMENMIAESMRNVAVPEQISERIRQTAEIIASGKEQAAADLSAGKSYISKNKTVRGNARVMKRSVKQRHWWKVPAAAAIAVLCTGVTVYAAAKLYQFRVEQKEAHLVEIGMRASDDGVSDAAADASGTLTLTDVPDVQMTVSYIPAGLRDNSAEKGGNTGSSYVQEDENGGYFIGEPMVMDMTEATWTADFVTEYETVQVNGRESLYLASQYGTDDEWVWKDLCIPFPEVSRIVLVQAWGHAPKEELLNIAEGIRLTQTGGNVSTDGMSLWSDYVAYKNTDLTAPVTDTVSVRNTATAEEMKHLHEIGEAYCPADTDYPQLEICVTDMRISDNASLLQQDMIQDLWNGVILSDGTIGTASREYYRHGDGQTSLNEVVYTEDVPLRLVYVTLEYTNLTDQDMENVYFFASLAQIVREGDDYRMVYVVPEDADGWKYRTQMLGTGEMFYYDTQSESGKNYIPLIGAGETQTVHVAWLVGEDETDNLYLSTSGDYGGLVFTDGMLEEGLVKLN